MLFSLPAGLCGLAQSEHFPHTLELCCTSEDATTYKDFDDLNNSQHSFTKLGHVQSENCAPFTVSRLNKFPQKAVKWEVST